ncbi:NAD(P)/FAD-dependent oxidoreductase [Zavarzinia sp. CC-PAN008]|uniref:NAD(P)/FAD-dependent oxidoreductase n=1 Tax=Zavarzinia sp. CC-PAN008 TaxID=3243332 RepID=UPI003F7422AB
MNTQTQTQNIVIAGSGFAGLWAALAAARAVAMAGREDAVTITVVSPEPRLVIRPRLYEAVLDSMAPDIGALLEAVGVRHVCGRVEVIRAGARHVEVATNDGGAPVMLAYDRLILATGSTLYMPPIPGLKEHGFNVDTLAAAEALERHLRSLASRPATRARNTVVVAGGGFTGIEGAAEMPDRLRAILGADQEVRVVIVERAPAVAWDMGDASRAVVEQALAELGVEVLAGSGVACVDAGGIVTGDGLRIAADTVLWTAGMRANALADQIPGDHDGLGRIVVDGFLRAPNAPGVFVTGDMARAATDDQGNVAVMSCQHALSLGRVAGHNAAAELAGLALHPYSQPKYVTCLDLGPWGALFTEGWDRQVRLIREEAKALKREINTKWIYPPAADRVAALAMAAPDAVIVA